MNRRGFLKLLGIGAATAVVAPSALAAASAAVKEGAGPLIAESNYNTFMYSGTFSSVSSGTYMYVRVIPSSLPLRAGDIVNFKTDKKGNPFAFRSKRLMDSKNTGWAINEITPGSYGFIQVVSKGNE